MTSRNATRVKGRVLRRSPRQLLSDGDEIKVGDYLFVFLDRGVDPSVDTVDAEPSAAPGDRVPLSHPWAFSPLWRTRTVMTLARQIYVSLDFGAMPILADALQDAECDNAYILDHCRCAGPHVRGCWVVDLVLGKK